MRTLSWFDKDAGPDGAGATRQLPRFHAQSRDCHVNCAVVDDAPATVTHTVVDGLGHNVVHLAESEAEALAEARRLNATPGGQPLRRVDGSRLYVV